MDEWSLVLLLILAASAAGFGAVFRWIWRLCARRLDAFDGFSHAQKADFCSRFTSTLHAAPCVCVMLYTLHIQEWDDNYMPLKSTWPTKCFFSITCGYFVFDFYLCTHFKVPLWRVFIVHHIAAGLPYFIYNFRNGCDADFYVLTLFLLVEIAVIPLNITTILEQLGQNKTSLHTFFFFLGYLVWFFSRVLLPVYLVQVIWQKVLPLALEMPLCVLPAALCGHFIALFCIVVFVFVWTPDVLVKLRERGVTWENLVGFPAIVDKLSGSRDSALLRPQGNKNEYGAVAGEDLEDAQPAAKANEPSIKL